MLSKRVPVLFEDKDYLLLSALASQSRKSVGDLIRQAVKASYIDNRQMDLQMRRVSYQELLDWQKKIGISKTPINYKELVDYGRKW